MKPWLCCMLLLGTSTMAQESGKSPAGLTQDLATLRDPKVSRAAVGRQITDDMMLLAGGNRQPLRAIVASFADELTGALAGKEMSDAQMAAIARPLADVMRGKSANYDSGTRFRQALKSVGVDMSHAEAVTRRFIAIGEEVRGPDDQPVGPREFLPRK